MALDAIPNHNDFFNMMLYETVDATQYGCYSGSMENASGAEHPWSLAGGSGLGSEMLQMGRVPGLVTASHGGKIEMQGRNKRKRRPKVCRNKEEAETLRMTHIAVKRNRRKLMNDHLAVLRSLMPESYAQRGDQASIVGGAIEYVKELEHLVHSLEAQKFLLLKQTEAIKSEPNERPTTGSHTNKLSATTLPEFLTDPQSSASQAGNKYALKSNTGISDIKVILIERHANLRILSKKTPMQLGKLVSAFQTLHLSILHLNVTSLESLVLYSINAKVEEGCQLTSVDSIAEAVHQMLSLIEQDPSSA